MYIIIFLSYAKIMYIIIKSEYVIMDLSYFKTLLSQIAHIVF